MKKFLSAIVLSSALLAAPLAHAGEQDAMAAGAVVGATTGAVIGSNTDQAIPGAFVGAVFGTIAGAILADASEGERVYVQEYHPYRAYHVEYRDREYRHGDRDGMRFERTERYRGHQDSRFERAAYHRDHDRQIGHREHREYRRR